MVQMYTLAAIATTRLGAGSVLVFVVPMVQAWRNSGVNAAGLTSMPIAMAEWSAANEARGWPMFAGVTGALGAFIAGSNAVSDLGWLYGTSSEHSSPPTQGTREVNADLSALSDRPGA